jgi:GNAT superfamily N-acetyltransferase
MFYSVNGPAAEVLLAFEGKSPVGFAVVFHNFSTWLGRPGLYLEDLFVKPEKRGKGYGRALLVELAKIARDRGGKTAEKLTYESSGTKEETRNFPRCRTRRQTHHSKQ